MVLFLKIFLKTAQIIVSQSDTVPTKFRNLGTIYLNHKASIEVNIQYVYTKAITVVTKTFVFDTKKPQSGRTEGAAVPAGAI
jgi:hypothetical protein